MNGAKHTPGPWTAQGAGVYAGRLLVDGGAGARTVAGCLTHLHGNEHDEEDKANARLIAEAPRMLAVLQKVVARGIANVTLADYREILETVAAAGGAL